MAVIFWRGFGGCQVILWLGFCPGRQSLNVTVAQLSGRAELPSWFGQSGCHADVGLVLYCLPYSGAGASIFQKWSRALPRTVAVAAIHLPVPEDRIPEPRSLRATEIAAAVAARTGTTREPDERYERRGSRPSADCGLILLAISRGTVIPVRANCPGREECSPAPV